MPLWLRAVELIVAKNVMQDVRNMETYLQESCADLDYTAVKIAFGKGQNETGLMIIFVLTPGKHVRELYTPSYPTFI